MFSPTDTIYILAIATFGLWNRVKPESVKTRYREGWTRCLQERYLWFSIYNLIDNE